MSNTKKSNTKKANTKKSLLQVSDDILVGLGRVCMVRRCNEEVVVYNDEGVGQFVGAIYPADQIQMPSEFTPLLQDAETPHFHWAFRRSNISGVRFTGDTAKVSIMGVTSAIKSELAKDGVVYAVVSDPLIRQQFQ